jgi:predicted AAA+ superfamily ATPase
MLHIIDAKCMLKYNDYTSIRSVIVMYRKAMQILEEWESKKRQEPLMIIGARQIGKTWLIKEFCNRTYKDHVYINFEENPDYASAFEGKLDPKWIIRTLEVLTGKIITADTPIFFDEIQVCEKAITSLKYFCEAEEHYRIICAGSLLGVKLNRFGSSFPVGKVMIRQMFPMDIEEFLVACGEGSLRDYILEAYINKEKIPEAIHQKALDLYHDYLMVGGMPAVVLDYLENDRSVIKMSTVLTDSLALSYLADMSKYVTSPSESVKITEVYNSVPRQLAKENPKFKFSEVKRGANSRDFNSPIEWLESSGMIYRINKLDTIAIPLAGYSDMSSYKIYLSDVGMLSRMCRLRPQDLISTADNRYKGPVVENYAIQQFKAGNMATYYYSPDAKMEIDIITEYQGETIPVEIKSGRRKRSTSLKNYCEAYHPHCSVRLSENQMGFTDELISLPLYATFVLSSIH